jgi:hypothetical protein
MGFRTVVVLSNDRAHEWQNDPELGNKIFHAASMQWCGGQDGKNRARQELPYGEVIEQVHADTQTVAFLDGYGGKAVAHSHWFHNQTEEQKNLAMLKALAEKLGYRVVKQSRKLPGLTGSAFAKDHPQD